MFSAFATWLCVIVAAESVTQHPLLVVLSFDAFRPDYVRPDVTPHMARLRRRSAVPPYMRIAFPTMTFVNHFTIATGLYPETHGVLNNKMFAVNDTGGVTTMYNTYEQFHYDRRVVPIWLQNEYSGNGRHSGVMMWPGSEFPYQGKTPTHCEKFNESMPWTHRIDKFMTWITDKTRPANLIFAYFEEPDTSSHRYGIKSQETKNQIVRVDTTIKYILDQIKNENLEDKINLIILSDHGMNTVKYDGMIFLNNYVSNDTCQIILIGPNAFVYPNPGKYDEVYTNLTKGAKSSLSFEVFKKEQLPERWHFKNTPRLDGILFLLAKPDFTFWTDSYENILEKTTKEKFIVGVHGYDNKFPPMNAFFMAYGPAFKKNFSAQPFDNIDLNPLISHIMSLEEQVDEVRPNGTMAGVKQLLSESNSGSSLITSTSSPIIQRVLMSITLHVLVARSL